LWAVDGLYYFKERDNISHGLSPSDGGKDKFIFGEERVVLHPSGVYSLARKALHQPPICTANEKVVLKLSDIFRALPDLFWDCMKLGNVEPKDMNTFFFGVPERQFNTYSQQFYVNTFIDKFVYESVKNRLPLSLEEKFNFDVQGASLHLKSKLSSAIIQDLVNLLDGFSTLLWNTNS